MSEFRQDLESEVTKIKSLIDSASDDTIWELHPYIGKQLKSRGLVRTRNITGERGEFLALKIYRDTIGLPNLQAAPEGTKNVDALSRDGERYAIKTISGKTVNTGIFAGLADRKEDAIDKKFEYLIIVVLDSDLKADSIFELTWEQFMELKYWNGGMKGWGLTVNKKLISMAKVIYKSPRAEGSTTWRKHLYSEC